MKENQQKELIDFYLWLDQEGKEALNEQTPPGGLKKWNKVSDRPPTKVIF
jgi:hypothetical protein